MNAQTSEPSMPNVGDWQLDLPEEDESLVYNPGDLSDDDGDNQNDAADGLVSLALLASNGPAAGSNHSSTNYLDLIEQNSCLRIRNETRVRSVYKKDGLFGLFSLFLTKKLKANIVEWTNLRLQRHHQPLLSMVELDAYLGLELAMSIVPLSNMRDFWRGDLLLGQEFFKAMMSRDRFLKIRAKLTFHDPRTTSVKQRASDPFYNFRFLMGHFQQTFTDIAEIYGNTAFDEMGVRFSGRHRGRTYAPNKPEKFVFQFYAEAHYESLYVSQMQVNDRGVNPKDAPAKYLRIYGYMIQPLRKVVNWMQMTGSSIDIKDPTALWMAMICQPYVANSESAHLKPKLVVTDNFYTR